MFGLLIWSVELLEFALAPFLAIVLGAETASTATLLIMLLLNLFPIILGRRRCMVFRLLKRLLILLVQSLLLRRGFVD